MPLLIKSFLWLVIFISTLFLVVWIIGAVPVLSGSLTHDEEHTEEIKGDDEKETVLIVDGYKAIQLEPKTVGTSGIAFKPLETISFKPESTAYAEVMNIEPLVSLKTEYQGLLAEKKILQSELNRQSKILQHGEALYQATNLSIQELEKRRADHELKIVQLAAINMKLAGFEYKVRSFWGEVLARFIFAQEKQDDMAHLASYDTALILLSLQKEKDLVHQQQKVFVSNINKRETALEASYLDRAKQSATPLYGESYFYVLDSKKLRIGMRLFAWIEESGQSLEGFFIPEHAVIWYADQPWIFLKYDHDLFIRKPLTTARRIVGGWLLEDKHLVGDGLLVVRGSQTLLSEEFKWAIPDEDND